MKPLLQIPISIALIPIAQSAFAIGLSSSKVDQNDPALSSVVELETADSICTGVLIAPRVVLTAAHCLAHQPDLDRVAVRFSANSEGSGTISKWSVHPAFKVSDAVWKRGRMVTYPDNFNDIAVGLLDQPAPSSVHPARLNNVSFNLKSKLEVRIFGYGVSTSKSEDWQLRQVDMNGIVHPRLQNKIYFDQTSGRGICYGDSGGPSFVYEGDEPVVVAISSNLSGAYRKGRYPKMANRSVTDMCQYNASALLVAPYLDWIKSAADSLLPR